MSKSIIVTGATGFIGHHLIPNLIKSNISVSVILRNTSVINHFPECVSPILVKKINDTLSLEHLRDQDVIIYLAAKVHQINDTSFSNLEAYRQVNRYAATSLAKQCMQNGVKRFVYLSSIKVNGEESTSRPFQEKSRPNPTDPYALSKWEAEQELLDLAKNSDLEVVIIRPPLIYGPQVRANFFQLLKLIDRHIPFPFASINNVRSLLYVGNLVDVIIQCIDHPQAKNQTFIVSDGEDLSTPELIHRLGKALGKSPLLFPFPPSLLKLTARLVGKQDMADRLLGSLQVDSSKIRQTLNWTPPYTVDEGLKITADWFKTRSSH